MFVMAYTFISVFTNMFVRPTYLLVIRSKCSPVTPPTCSSVPRPICSSVTRLACSPVPRSGCWPVTRLTYSPVNRPTCSPVTRRTCSLMTRPTYGHKWPANVFTSDSAHMLRRDLANIFTGELELGQTFTSDSTNMCTSDSANMFNSDQGCHTWYGVLHNTFSKIVQSIQIFGHIFEKRKSSPAFS